MNELIKKLMEQADLTEDKAEKVVRQVLEYLKDAIPGTMDDKIIEKLMSGEKVEGLAEKATGAIKGLFK